MRIVCWQAILMKYHTLFFLKLGKMLQNLSSAAVMIGALRVKIVHQHLVYSQTCVKQPLTKRLKIGFQYQLSLNGGQKYCRMLHGEHSAILSTFIKLPFVIRYLFLILSGRFTHVLL